MIRRANFTSIVFASLVGTLQAGLVLAQSAAMPNSLPPMTQAHTVAGAKVIVGDLRANQAFYETIFGMKEATRLSSKDIYEESIMTFEGAGNDAFLALFQPLKEPALTKAAAPVVLLYTPEFDAVVKRIEDAKLPLRRLRQTSPQIAITRDPSGNAVEFIAREGKPWSVGGAKLIVSNRQQAEDFFVAVFDAKPAQRFQTKGYDEVIMSLGEGAWVALFQPLDESPLPKSQFPVVAIYTKQFDAVVQRIASRGLGHRELKPGASKMRIVIAQDPSGNAVEIIDR